MLTEQQIKERVDYIGGSDIPPIMGMSSYKTLLQVWGEKTGQIPAEDISDKIQVRLGNKLEAVIAELFEEDTGKKLRLGNKAIKHPSYSFLRGHVDREVVGENSVVEIKSTSAWRAKELKGESCPPEWILQIMYYMAIGDYDRGYLAYTIGNQEFAIKIVERDSALIGQIIKQAVNFWGKYVKPKVFPQVISKDDSETLNKLFPHGQEETPITLGDDANKLIESIKALKQDNINLEGMIDKEENELKAMLKDNAIGVTDRWRVTWKDQERTSIDSKSLKEKQLDIYEKFSRKSKFRVLKVNPLKEK